ncbi:MAG: phosphocholine cytidylyltransferase family protein, partial [Planctomycetes bacterium]|nr:phosphocholine cytidylyltransferase family protein [Planctomycetota bacterium]
MQAIILAAGVGKRLKPLTDQRPKCLIEIGGKTLLARCLDSLEELGIRDITIVLGHLKDMILEEINTLGKDDGKGLRFSYLVNEGYKNGSVTSLWIAREKLVEEALIMDADVLFHPTLLERLVRSPKTSCFLMEESFTDTGEEMKLFLENDRVIAISKENKAKSSRVGEGVGFLKLSAEHGPTLRKALEDLINEGRLDAEYEEAIDRCLAQSDMGVESVDGLPWIEIDFAEDVQRAEREILPRL